MLSRQQYSQEWRNHVSYYQRTRCCTPPEAVWNALTQPDHLARWWADEALVAPVVGSLGEFRFRPPAGTLQFQVVELDAHANIRWLSRQGPPAWAGTTVTWQLTPVQDGTRVVFTHAGFAQKDASYERTSKNWEYFLGSLRAYLEDGKGTPGLPPMM